tara:strand:- start:5 stop:742 length:738 start_codon:yes stop_codon:yes gene_type:complete
MNQDTLIVSNWKMNLNFDSATQLINKIKKIKFPNSSKIKNIVCPQFLLIPQISKLVMRSKIILGSQDCHHKISGSFTGDSSLELLKHFHCRYVILGHSERRICHYENNMMVRKKVDFVLANKLNPIVCVGESLKERQNGKYLETISKQLDECLPEKLKSIVIAYEPVWSIGSGSTPTFKEISEINDYTNNFLCKQKKIQKVSFLYGGSVNSKNFFDIMNHCNVNGALIGGSSIKFDEINKILLYA